VLGPVLHAAVVIPIGARNRARSRLENFEARNERC
jgi:hypothetical protein